MIIKTINIKSFGQLCNMTLDFSDNVNVIEGQNEAGKSTIAAFIKYMLYGFDNTEAPGALSERKKRINWDTGIAEGSMNVVVGGKEYLITRTTVITENGGKTAYKEDSSIIDLENGTPAFGKQPAGEVFFGVDRELFENTAFLGQLGDAAIKEGCVKDSIENILFSANEKVNTQRASNLIAEKMETLLHQGNTGGAIIDLMRKQEALEEKLRATDEANKQILAKEAELHDIRTKKEEAEAKRDKLLDLDRCYRNVMLIQTFDKLHELEEDCVAKTEAYNSFIKENTKGDFVPSGDYLTDLALARRSVKEAEVNLAYCEAAFVKERSAIGITKEIENAIALSDSMGGEEKVKEDLAAYSSGKSKSLFGAIFAAAVLLASIVFEIAGAAMPAATKILVWILAAISLAGAAILGFVYAKSCKGIAALSESFSVSGKAELLEKIEIIARARAKRDTINENIEAARAALEDAKFRLENARGELSRTMLRWGDQPSLSEDIDVYLDKLEARVRGFLAEMSRLGEEKNTIELTVREIRRTLSDKSEIDIRAQVSPLKRKVLSEINHEEIINGIAAAKAVIDEQQRLLFSAENELASLKLRATDPGELYSKIQALEAKISDLRTKHKAYFVALRAIGTASDNLRAEISPRLGEYAQDLLKIMTEKKYSSLGVDTGLKVNFEDAEGARRSVDYLSGGTRDLAYVAVRMALIDMLYSEKPPICLDETFASQDNKRAESMMKAIAKLAADGYQSFIFTCRAREATLASEAVKGAGIFRLSVEE